MMKDDKIINKLIYGDTAEKIAALKNVSLQEANQEISRMSFAEYRTVLEANIIPPSGQQIGGTNQPRQPGQPQQPQQKRPFSPQNQVGQQPGQAQQMQPGQPQQPQQIVPPGQVQQPQQMQPGQPQQPGAPIATVPGTTVPTTEEDQELMRLKELAGIGEDCSGGAVGAGAIASSTAIIPGKRRKTTEEGALKSEYTRKIPAKTIAGDTKPNQASGQLSANLAASGKPSASRTNNGFKR
jgi:hypothetical protein